MNVTLVMLKAEYEKELERAHQAFIETPNPDTAWRLATAAECLLDVLREI